MRSFSQKDDKSHYLPLSSTETERLTTGDDETDVKPVPDHLFLELSLRKWGAGWRLVALLELLVIIVISTFFVLNTSSTRNNCLGAEDDYTLGREVLEYEDVVFHNSIYSDTTPYQGPPSDELDARWEELYGADISWISKEEADRLPNRTSQIADQPGRYITILGVFHELHCLNWLRQAMYPDYYPDRDVRNATTRIHMEHCIDILRQASMCYPDRTPVVFQWSEKAQISAPTFNVVHRCTKFENLQEWGKARRVQRYDTSVWVEGNPLLQGGDKHFHVETGE